MKDLADLSISPNEFRVETMLTLPIIDRNISKLEKYFGVDNKGITELRAMYETINGMVN